MANADRWWSRSPSLMVKRAMDIAGATTAIVATAPIVGAAALVNAFSGPVLFRQLRPGYRGRPFSIYKLRTMRPVREGEVWFRTDAERVTRLGGFLRATSIDELPELWNVLAGDMSLVGPRPLLMEYLDKYTPQERRRHDMPPGITGLAQVEGRQTIPFSKRLELDVRYVDEWSLMLDLMLLARTVVAVFQRRDVIVGQDVDDVDDIGLSADRQRQPAGGHSRAS